MGELMLMYAAADIAFVAGSLKPVGGHNFLEPWLLDIPVIVGPQMFNFERITQQAAEQNAIIQIDTLEQFADALIRLFTDDQQRQTLIANAQVLLQANKGSLNRTYQLIERF